MRLEQNTLSILGPNSSLKRTSKGSLFWLLRQKAWGILVFNALFCDSWTLAFINSSFSGKAPDLAFLDSIQEIHGCLMMSDNIIPSISLKNLRIVRGYQFFETHLKGLKKKWTIYVSMNYDTESTTPSKDMSPLRHLDMRSLKCESLLTFLKSVIFRNVTTTKILRFPSR